MRITEKVFTAEVKQANYYQALSGSNIFYAVGGRYNMTALDEKIVKEEGQTEGISRNLELGTPRECLQKLAIEQRLSSGKLQTSSEPTRKQAKKCLSFAIDFNSDFHTLDSFQVGALLIWAKRTKYRKPKNANGSRGRYFFQHLQKRVKL